MKISKKTILILVLGIILSLNCAIPSFSQPDVIDISADKNNIPEEKANDSAEGQPILSVLETNLNSSTAEEGEDFSAKLMEDVNSENKIAVPKFSMISGFITGIKKANKLGRNASIKLNITKITTPDEKNISLEDKPMLVEIFPPNYKSTKEKLVEKLPSTIASSATSLILGKYSSAGEIAVWAASTGAGMVAGMVSGLVSPDKGKTRALTSAERAIKSTTLGSASSVIKVIKKGESFSLAAGQYICIYFDKETIKHIKENNFTEQVY